MSKTVCVECLSSEYTSASYTICSGCYQKMRTTQGIAGADWEAYQKLLGASKRLALFLREAYPLEIGAGEHNGIPAAEDVAIHYMLVERGRWRVRLRYLMRWIMGGGE